MIEDVAAWRAEVLATGNIVQDNDNSVPQEEGEKRFERYVELVNMVTGDEGDDVFQTLIDSIQARQDYGAYQHTIVALERFPAAAFGRPFLEAHVPLIARQAEWAGDLLISVVADPDCRAAFNRALAVVPAALRDPELAFIRAEEQGGWLRDHVGELHPTPNGTGNGH